LKDDKKDEEIADFWIDLTEAQSALEKLKELADLQQGQLRQEVSTVRVSLAKTKEELWLAKQKNTLDASDATQNEEALTVQSNEKAGEIANLWKNVTETQTALEKSKQDFADALRVLELEWNTGMSNK
jgi:hypothetical protein